MSKHEGTNADLSSEPPVSGGEFAAVDEHSPADAEAAVNTAMDATVKALEDADPEERAKLVDTINAKMNPLGIQAEDQTTTLTAKEIVERRVKLAAALSAKTLADIHVALPDGDEEARMARVAIILAKKAKRRR